MDSARSHTLDADFVESVALGAGILGTGGGGNPYYAKLNALRTLSKVDNVELVNADEISDDATCVAVGGMGAPSISVEKVRRGDEALVAMRALEKRMSQRVEYVIPGEIGGSNALWPLVVAAHAGIPVVDGDGMGRAFPELQQDTYSIYGLSCTPAAIADAKHNTVIFDTLEDTVTLERCARAVTVQMGGSAGYAFPIMSGRQLKEAAVPHTITFAEQIGSAVREARAKHRDPVAAVLEHVDGEILFQGKIVDVERRLTAGFNRGTIRLQSLESKSNSILEIDLQNEYLVARRDEEILATVPDLICLMDLITGEPVTTEVARYGLRVAALIIPAPAQLRTAQALGVIGPGAFGYQNVHYYPYPGTYGAKPPPEERL